LNVEPLGHYHSAGEEGEDGYNTYTFRLNGKDGKIYESALEYIESDLREISTYNYPLYRYSLVF
jgi:hypothetical protein